MASQGQCLFEHYVLLRLYLERLQPETVLLFVFLNDFRDLEKARTGQEIESMPERRRYDFDAISNRVQSAITARPAWAIRLTTGGLGARTHRDPPKTGGRMGTLCPIPGHPAPSGNGKEKRRCSSKSTCSRASWRRSGRRS